MKSRWFNIFGACVLPPLVGAGFGGGLMHVLKSQDITPATALLHVEAGKKKPGRGHEGSAEIRAALPLDAVFDPELPTRLPAPADTQEKVKKASEMGSPRTPPKPAATESAVAAKPSTPKTKKSQPREAFTPPVWRPLLDPGIEHWTRLMPRTEALPQAYQAVLNDDPEHLAKVIALGISPSEPTLGGDTPLCAAVRMGRADCIRVLALAGVDMGQTAHEGQPPMALAALRRNAEVLQALLDAGVDPNTRFKTPVLREVIERCTIKDLRNALESDRGITPLICCAARGDVEGAITLMRGGAKSSVCTTRYHRYPINFAATQGYLFLMRVLLGRDPDSEPNLLVTVDLSKQRAWVTREGRVINSTSVSTGREGYNTPAGRYVITDKHRSHTSTLYHVAMPWFMRLNCGAIGLHSGYVTGRPASHGCIRLPYEKAREFFQQVAVGDEVQIVH